MKFTKLGLEGALLIEPEKISDHRGFFARVWCQNEFKNNKLNSHLVQSNISFNLKEGTVRGLHYQREPYSEAKLVRCTKGAIYDVIVDMREQSTSYTNWEALILTEENYKMLYVPEGFAHGYQTLKDNTEVFYHVSHFYHPKYEMSIRWDDPILGIKWPLTVSAISKKDESAQLLKM